MMNAQNREFTLLYFQFVIIRIGHQGAPDFVSKDGPFMNTVQAKSKCVLNVHVVPHAWPNVDMGQAGQIKVMSIQMLELASGAR